MHVSYRWNEQYLTNPHYGVLKLLTEYHYYISNDPNHDVFFVKHFFDLHWKHLTDRGLLYNLYIVWNDGCAGQFKFRQTMFQVAL